MKRIISIMMITHQTILSTEGKPINIKIIMKNFSLHTFKEMDLIYLKMTSSKIIEMASMMIIQTTIKTQYRYHP
jgi:hypothetical protein